LLTLAKPALLIPLATNASRGDQILNARSFESQGFSKLLYQDQLSKDTLIRQIKSVYQDRAKMISAMKESSIPDGLRVVVKLIEEQTNR
jgi:UDP-N-acetylglucosamine--N-acetylmuramyl-(pentapeptide) pyrophosphoryl-undecaprenol N-acetylglucosamine transferase